MTEDDINNLLDEVDTLSKRDYPQADELPADWEVI